MSNIYPSIDAAIGHTPLVELCNIEKAFGLKAKLYVKVESMNPGGSVKDRVGLAMIDAAVAKYVK